ncbi:aldo/keto reductase, partial [Streptomyces sp. NRRL F-5122]|uniref:aldo/keto reductase n=2 Tax=Streptomyces TaxID=1883 RepID=UPI000A9194AD
MAPSTCRLGVSALHNQAKFVANQTHYSLLSRDAERDLVPMAEEAGLSLTVWQPLVGGSLTGKFDRGGVSTEQDSRRAGNAFDFVPFDEEKGFTVLAALRTVAARHEVSPARVAIAWLLAQRAVTSVIVGARKLEQLTDNIAAS